MGGEEEKDGRGNGINGKTINISRNQIRKQNINRSRIPPLSLFIIIIIIIIIITIIIIIDLNMPGRKGRENNYMTYLNSLDTIWNEKEKGLKHIINKYKCQKL